MNSGADNKQVENIESQTFEQCLRAMGIKVPTGGSHYVNNEELYKHMVKYTNAREHAKKHGLPKPAVDDYIGESIMKIATHLAYRPNFSGYSYKNEMISDAIENCLQYIDSFDINKSKNVFAYITQVCWCAFIRRLKIEKKQNIIKGKLMIRSQMDESSFYLEEDDDQKIVFDEVNNVHTFVELAQEEEEKVRQKHAEKQKEKMLKKQEIQRANSLCYLFERQ